LKIIQCSETSSEYQAKEVKWQQCPEHMSAYKETPHTGFLGGIIVGKLVFGSGGYGFISKKDYNERGPYVHSRPVA
jgi:actin-related protein 7